MSFVLASLAGLVVGAIIYHVGYQQGKSDTLDVLFDGE